MSILYMDGYELGTILAEANTMSGNVMASTYLSGISFSAASSGLGRSLKLNNAPGISNASARIGAPVTLPTISTITQLNVGFRGALSTTYNAGNTFGGTGFGANSASNNLVAGLVLYRSANAPSTLLEVWTGNAKLGQFTVGDTALHYYTFNFKANGSNWDILIYQDRTVVFSVINQTIAFTTASNFFHSIAAQTTATSTEAFSELDDTYVTVNQPPYGNFIISKVNAAADVQAQWTKVGGQPTNYQSVDNISLTTGNSLTTSTAAQDIYGTATALAVNKKAVLINASLVANGSPSDTLVAQASSGVNSVSSSAIALSAVDSRISTGWVPLIIASNDLTTLRYGQAKQ